MLPNSATQLLLLPILLLGILSAAAAAADSGQPRPLDEYVLAAQSECFTSKRIVSCFRYKAARYLWSAASGRMNFFQSDQQAARKMAQAGAEAGAEDPVRGSFEFVQLSEPSTAVVFPGARQEIGDSAAVQLWKFIRRSWATFLGSHGIRFGVDTATGGRIIGAEEDAPKVADQPLQQQSRAKEEPRIKRKKWQVIVPLAILGKLMHLKWMLVTILFSLGVTQAMLIAGGTLVYYYLKHHTMCRFEPHVTHTHSHVVDAIPDDTESMRLWKFAQRSIQSFLTSHGVHFTIDNQAGTQVVSVEDEDGDEDVDGSRAIEESRRKKNRKHKRKKWHIILPLAILLKLTHLKLMLLKVLLGIGGVQLILIVFGGLLFHYLKNNTLCKIQPHLVHTHSHLAEEPETTYSSYGHGATYGGSSHGSFNKDWASKRAYSAYSFLDAITDAD